MATVDEIRTIELRRLAELEKQRAYTGIDCPPEILIEISDLRSKYGAQATAVSVAVGPDSNTGSGRELTRRDLSNEVDFLRAICTAALREFAADKESRVGRQRILNLWLLFLTVMMLLLLGGRFL